MICGNHEKVLEPVVNNVVEFCANLAVFHLFSNKQEWKKYRVEHKNGLCIINASQFFNLMSSWNLPEEGRKRIIGN